MNETEFYEMIRKEYPEVKEEEINLILFLALLFDNYLDFIAPIQLH